MTAKHTIPGPKGVPIKDPAWFSWRHRTRDAHDEAVAAYLDTRGPAARRRRADERAKGKEQDDE